MQTSFNCPNCSNVLQAETTWSGQQTQCPYCKNMIVIPQFSATAPQGAIPPNPGSPMGYAPSIVQNKDFFMIRLFNSLFDSLLLYKQGYPLVLITPVYHILICFSK